MIYRNYNNNLLGIKKMKKLILAFLVGIVATANLLATEENKTTNFNPQKDLLSLHYDQAPDKDDGHSAAADRTILESLYGRDWIKKHVVAVSGTYGKNAKTFNSKSDAVMDATWNDCGGWISCHNNREQGVADLIKRWNAVLEAGGDVWVKEGGQSDVTAEVVRKIKAESPNLNTTVRIHVVQHSDWNEKQTTNAALAYTKKQTQYIRIRDANSYLDVSGGNASFEKAALAHPVFGSAWKAAFAYYNPKDRLDFSDTGELMHLLGLGEIDIDNFRKRFLADNRKGTPNKPDASNDK